MDTTEDTILAGTGMEGGTLRTDSGAQPNRPAAVARQAPAL